MKETIRISIRFFILFTIICGFIYPMFITIVSQVVFKEKANGSIIELDGKKVGSKIIGQEFKDENNFWTRPSASNYKYSVATNKSPNDKELINKHEEIKKYLEDTSNNEKIVPKDLYTYSGSGLDPNITYESAMFQIDRIAKNRNIEKQKLERLIEINLENTADKEIKMINVLKLNIELNKLF